MKEQDNSRINAEIAEFLYFRALFYGLESGKIDYTDLWNEAATLGNWDQQIDEIKRKGGFQK